VEIHITSQLENLKMYPFLRCKHNRKTYYAASCCVVVGPGVGKFPKSRFDDDPKQKPIIIHPSFHA